MLTFSENQGSHWSLVISQELEILPQRPVPLKNFQLATGIRNKKILDFRLRGAKSPGLTLFRLSAKSKIQNCYDALLSQDFTVSSQVTGWC